MKPNIALGQVWRTDSGHRTTIVRFDGADTELPWLGSDGFFYTDEGAALDLLDQTCCELVELLVDVA